MAKRKKSTTRGKSSSSSSGKTGKRTRKTTSKRTSSKGSTSRGTRKGASTQATATAPTPQPGQGSQPQAPSHGQRPAPALPQRAGQPPATPHPMAQQPQAQQPQAPRQERPTQPQQRQRRPAHPPQQQPRTQPGADQQPVQGHAPQAAAQPPAPQHASQPPAPPQQPAAPGQRPARHEPPADLPYHSSPMTASIRDFVESTPTVSAEELPRVVRSPRPARPVPLDQVDPLTQAQIYETLAALFVPYARKMESEWHPKIGYCLKARNEMNGRESHFCAVQTMEEGVAYHLFPLYGHPEHLQSVSPLVASRLATQTCFFFTEINAAVVAELAHLTHLCFESFQADGQG